DVPSLLGRSTEAARSEFETGLSEATAWAEWARVGAPNANGCIICGSSGPLELHHVAGKNNSETVVPVCRPCHERLGERQNGWDPRWIRDDNPPELRESLFLRGLSDLCEERGRFGAAYHVLGKRLRAVYAKTARGSAS
ncbi:hypothetical protein B1B_09607, partial [mine drainage metagenome]